ncbi:MFS transporter [Serratia sp. UGAL515B_01]|uniref:MFS transporter n=1 Tax=Serratia sp. UGAL515B_01 TaxID=2986763 RepID=UPI002953FB2E|nr:MFS transporter [Serratia sp. UGAL515B_01]WON77000.1 MFS transporter [Serratia sp. UGAL515B_01]
MMGNNKQFKLIFIASFLASLSYGVMLTLPVYLTKNLNYPVSFSGEVISLGVIGVLISIITLPSTLKVFSNKVLSSFGAMVYSLAIICIITGLQPLLFLAGFLLGFGWGVIYTMGPIMVSEASNENNRSKNFSFISAFNMLGAGIAPILVKISLDVNIDMGTILYLASSISILSGLLFIITRLCPVTIFCTI